MEPIIQQENAAETPLRNDDGDPPGEALDVCERGIARQREVCTELLSRWVPLATAETLELRKEGRSGPVVEADDFDAGLKASALVLKVLERLSRLDGLDAAEKRETAPAKSVSHGELARRVQLTLPILSARLAAGKEAEKTRRGIAEN